MKYIIYLQILVICIFSTIIFNNVNALQTMFITPNTSTCQYEGPYDSLTGNFQCASNINGSSSTWNIQTYSYLIYQNGLNYYALNGKTGNIDFQGTDAYYVIQSSWNQMPSGVMIVNNGTYILSHSLILNSSGKLNNFIATFSSFRANSSSVNPVIEIYGGVAKKYSIGEINGNNQNVIGLKIQDTSQSDIFVNYIGGIKTAILADATDNNNLAGNKIELISTNANNGIAFDFEPGTTTGSIQGNQIFFNFITGASIGIKINSSTSNFAYNEINGNAIDDTGVLNSYGIYIMGKMTGNIININGFLGSNSIAEIGGNSNVGSHTNAANIENSIINLALQDNKINIVGDKIQIHNLTYIQQGSTSSPISASVTSGLSNFNSGIALYSNENVLSIQIPPLSLGQTKTFYFYNNLISGPVDEYQTSIVNDGGYPIMISSTSSDPSWGNPGLGIISIRALANNPQMTAEILVNISK